MNTHAIKTPDLIFMGLRSYTNEAHLTNERGEMTTRYKCTRQVLKKQPVEVQDFGIRGEAPYGIHTSN